jgi:hypothetical protein
MIAVRGNEIAAPEGREARFYAAAGLPVKGNAPAITLEIQRSIATVSQYHMHRAAQKKSGRDWPGRFQTSVRSAA